MTKRALAHAPLVNGSATPVAGANGERQPHRRQLRLARNLRRETQGPQGRKADDRDPRRWGILPPLVA